jgi:hypothetical protein
MTCRGVALHGVSKVEVGEGILHFSATSCLLCRIEEVFLALAICGRGRRLLDLLASGK